MNNFRGHKRIDISASGGGLVGMAGIVGFFRQGAMLRLPMMVGRSFSARRLAAQAQL